MRKKFQLKDVKSYIAASPKGVRAKLAQIRKIIKVVAPKADEYISYGIPYYGYEGRLAYFAAFKNHISLFVPTPIIEEHGHELGGYETSKATVYFPLDKPLPVMLIKKLIKARIKKNTINRKIGADI